jgi:hypothetical protein
MWELIGKRVELAFAIAIVCSPPVFAQAGGSAVVARTGELAPGSTEAFTGFGVPSLNNAGDAAFGASTNGSQPDLEYALYPRSR